MKKQERLLKGVDEEKKRLRELEREQKRTTKKIKEGFS